MGLGGILGKKKHAEGVAQVWAAFGHDHARWEAEVAALPAAQFQQVQAYTAALPSQWRRCETTRAQVVAAGF